MKHTEPHNQCVLSSLGRILHRTRRLLCAAAILTSTALPSVAAAATLVHHYPFDVDGTDVVGTTNLSLVNGATISSAPADVRIGTGAIDLTGASKAVSNSGVVFGNKFSISLFTRLDTSGGFMTFLATAPGGTGSPGFKFFSRRLRQLSMAWEDTQNSESNADVLAVGQYHHLAAVVDKSAGTVTYYRDGILVGTFSVATNFTDGLPFSVGDFGGAGGFTGHEGVIDDLKIYNGLLTAGEVATLAAGIATIIDDKFDDGNIATNTLGIGNGFTNSSQSTLVTESGGFLNLDVNDSYQTRVFSSNAANSVNPFLSSATALTYKFGVLGRDTQYQRTWIGYRVPGGSDHFYPNTGTQGLYLSVISQNQGEDGWANHGNLIAVSNSGAMTTLASWNWANPNALAGLKVKLTTTSTQYLMEFSEAAGGVPTFVTGGASGSLTGMGTIDSNFNVAIHNQYWFGNDGGGVKLDSVLLQSGVPFTPPPTNTAPTNIALSSSSIPENNTAGAQIGTLSATDVNSGDTHTFTLVSGSGDSDNGAFTITGNALTINASADFETKASYNIRIRATDSGAGSLTFEKQFTVSITDVTIPQVINFGALAGKTFGDADFNVSATGGASGQPVTFSITSGPATVSGDLVSITGAGEVTVRASQAAFGDYSAASDVDQTFTVAQAAQTINFAALGGKTFGDLPFVVSATGGASAQPVTFSIVSGPATIAADTVTITGAGDVTVRASQAGTANYAAATPVDRTFTVAKAAQSITFTARSIAGTTDTLTLSATGGATGNAVTFSVFSGPGSLAGNVLSFTGAGSVIVRASQAGNADFDAAADVDAAINVVVNATPVAVDDAVALTTGTTVVYPLANDTDADGEELTITAVSESSVTIVGRTLIIPEGFSGPLTYTVSDGIGFDSADVVVTAGTAVTNARKWSGLLQDGDRAISGWVQISGNAFGSYTASIKAGTAKGRVTFTIPGTNTATVATAVGALTVTKNTNGRLDISLVASGETLTSSLRPGVTSTTARQLNVALAGSDSTIPGGGVIRAKVAIGGTITISGTLPDGRKISTSSHLADNDSFAIYSVIASTSPKAVLGGEATIAGLIATDVTGEIAWFKPPQTSGLHRSGVDTVLTANGCEYTNGMALPNGLATLTVAGGNFPTPISTAIIAANGQPSAASVLVPRWIVNASAGTFVPQVKNAANRRVNGAGIYLPKSNRAWGYFPGTTVGGRIELTVP